MHLIDGISLCSHQYTAIGDTCIEVLLQPMEGDKYFVHYAASCYFYLENFTLERKLGMMHFSGGLNFLSAPLRKEHAALGNIHRQESLQETMQIRSMSVHWQSLSQEELKGSGHSDRTCNSKQKAGDSRTSFQLTVLITSEHCSPCGTI